MTIEPIELELTRCRAMLEAAREAYWESKFDYAEELYRATLSALEQIYASDTSDVAVCLMGLADTYYFQNKYGLALPFFTRALAAREKAFDTNKVDVLAVLFKLAKTCDRLGQWDEANAHYKRAVEIAQKCLLLGHPLLTSIMEAYAEFLRRSRPGTGLADAMEEKARQSREKYFDPDNLVANILENLPPDSEDAESESNAKGAIWKDSQSDAESNNWLLQKVRKIKHNKPLVFSIVFGPLVATLLGVLVYGVEQALFDTTRDVSPGESFTSVDGHKQLRFLDAKYAEQVAYGAKYRSPYGQIVNPWKEIFEPPATAAWFLIKGDRLRDSSGVVLKRYSKDHMLEENMMLAAQSLEQYVSKQGKLPESLTEWSTADKRLFLKNPYTDSSMPVGLVRVSAEELGIITAEPAYLRRFEDLEKRVSVATPPKGSTMVLLFPGSETAKPSYIVVGGDQSGSLLPDCSGNSMLYIYGDFSGNPRIACRQEPAGVQAAKVVVSRWPAGHLRLLTAKIVIQFYLALPLLVILYMMSKSGKVATGCGNEWNSGMQAYLDWIFPLLAMAYIWYSCYVFYDIFFSQPVF